MFIVAWFPVQDTFISMPHILGNNLDFLEPSQNSCYSKVEQDVAQIDVIVRRPQQLFAV